MSDSAEHTYLVRGMSCEHCRAAVLEEVSSVAGVTDVEIDLGAGRMIVRGRAVDELQVRTAVEEAGYEVEG